jgi:hypothetical protein
MTATPDCCTVMVRVIPLPATVMVPVRVVVDVLATTETVMDPLFEPEVGEMVIQDAERLTVQLTLDSTEKV